MTSLKMWRDKRSGRTGQKAGDAVLKYIMSQTDESLTHEKGTIFSTEDRVFVGRVCATDQYLQRGIVHFSNISKDQHRSLVNEKKDLYYLFITVKDGNAHFWTVPSRIIGSALSELTPKPDTSTCFLRIVEKNGKFYIGETNISRYHDKVAIRTAALVKA